MLNLVLCAIILLAFVTIYIGTFIKKKPIESKASRFYLALVITHAVYIICARHNFGDNRFINAGAPFGLLYGPLFFFAFSTIAGERIKNLYLHFIPFVVFAGVFTVFLIEPDLKLPYGITYFIFLFSFIVMSLAIYSLHYIFKNTAYDIKNKDVRKILRIWSFCFIMIAFLLTSILFTRIIPEKNIKVELPAILVYALIFTTVWLIFKYTLTYFIKETEAKPIVITQETTTAKYLKSSMKTEDFENYKKKLDLLFQKEQIYLQNELTLDMLSKKLKISRHYLTQLFNVYIGENFNSYVNRHRIDHAIHLLNTLQEKISIEDLAYKSGFNSKVSFNRHFKNITGYSPSEYINKKKDC